MFGAGDGAHGAGYLLPDFGHADFLFGGVVGEGHCRVDGEFEIVVDAPVEASGEGAVLVAEFALGVVRGEDAMSDEAGLRRHGRGVDGLAGSGCGGAVQGEQGESDLIGPAPGVGVVLGLVVVGDGLEFAQDVGVA